ncbi:MAG: bifunctional molybdenum cofactor biosynthesis protein MoaC/MoaB [Micavibrio aeruginosavorus]|uniref:Bifunctional molybdenum cofactor biosynthesis protein MoaC/MoaB n=1 Tax=Micavibrio aeruginosavorus TaxID=349221 RepID=A0A7T5UHK0_9BACT|nr:MAG: bifunctional molybdenum cofactor biosynthesis protein MoaC/MoaB [Micavibrio aeruginosavorus]
MDFPADDGAQFRMIDVGRKRVTRRRAVAEGKITVGPVAFEKIKSKSLPKGDVLALAEMAGITGAKKTPETLLMCHSLPLDQVTIHCVLEAPASVRVYAQVAAHAKTGVEMEAVMAVQAALATIWDLTKGTEPNLLIGDIRLLVKEGGKSGLWVNPDGIPAWLAEQLPPARPLEGVPVAVIVMSDRAHAGVYEDKSGSWLVEELKASGAQIADYSVIPDDENIIFSTMRRVYEQKQPKLMIMSGGTGPGPRDVTPEVMHRACDRILQGFGEMLRRESAAYTDTAWLSRMEAGMMGNALVMALPGSPKAVFECWEIISPIIARTLKMIATQGFEKQAGGKP